MRLDSRYHVRRAGEAGYAVALEMRSNGRVDGKIFWIISQ